MRTGSSWSMRYVQWMYQWSRHFIYCPVADSTTVADVVCCCCCCCCCMNRALNSECGSTNQQQQRREEVEARRRWWRVDLQEVKTCLHVMKCPLVCVWCVVTRTLGGRSESIHTLLRCWWRWCRCWLWPHIISCEQLRTWVYGWSVAGRTMMTVSRVIATPWVER